MPVNDVTDVLNDGLTLAVAPARDRDRCSNWPNTKLILSQKVLSQISMNKIKAKSPSPLLSHKLSSNAAPTAKITSDFVYK